MAKQIIGNKGDKMKKILILYSTGEGHTGTIAEKIQEEIKTEDTEVDVVRFRNRNTAVDFSEYDVVVIGASVHAGRFSTPFCAFLNNAADVLSGKPVAFFHVSLTGKGDTDESRATGEKYLTDFLAQTGVKPAATGNFKGALLFKEYGFLKKTLMKAISKGAGKTADTSKNYIYTDWADVSDFSKAVKKLTG